MKNLLFVIALTLSAFSVKAQSKPSVAVLDFDTRGYNEVERYQIIQKLSLEMINMSGYEVMDNYDIEYISERDEKDFTGCFSRICLKEYGEQLEVDFILTGSMNLLGEKVSTTVRLFDVAEGKFVKSTNRNYVDVPKNDLLMAELALKDMLGVEVDPELVRRVTVANDYDNILNNPFDRTLVAEGPRMGFGFVTGNNAKILAKPLNEGGFNQQIPLSSQFGYQFEKAYITTGNWQALAEIVPMISGLESNRFIPNLTILNGLRSNNSGWEFAFGPTIDVSRALDGQLDSRGEISFSTALVFSVGKTVKSGEMNFPINAFLIPPKDGSSYRFGLSMGWNAAKKKRLFD
jgi:TolB-like protein